VETACHPTLDLLAVTVRGRVPVAFEFPYGSPAMNAADWDHPQSHSSEATASGAERMEIARQLDGDRYSVAVAWHTSAAMNREGPHRFVLQPAENRLDFVCAFRRSGQGPSSPPGAAETLAASREKWSEFWSTGGLVDLSAASDPRVRELERRIVLSQYLTAIQCAGSLPPRAGPK
jgi:hypothetical protein